MAKTVLHRLLGVGRVPRGSRPALEAEGIVILDEGIAGSVTYRHFHAPGKRFSFRRTSFTGSVIATAARFAAFAYGRRVVNVTFDDPRLAQVAASVESGRLVVTFDAALFHENMSGKVELRYRTNEADRFAGLLQEAGCGRVTAAGRGSVTAGPEA